MDYAETLEQMNIVLGDTDNITFTPEEKQRALTKAWNDPYVIDDVWNTAGTFDNTNYQTPLPSGVTTVKDIGMAASGEFPDSIDAQYWSVVGSNIQWSKDAKYSLTNGGGLYILGTKKLDPDTDTLDTAKLQEYVIALGSVNTLTLLGYKKANLFLKNDLTMGELITLKRELQGDVQRMRNEFAKQWQDV